MTVLILVLMLLSVNVLWSVDVVTKEAVKLVKNQINVSLYFKAEALDKEVTDVKKYLALFPEVTDLQLLSREEVLKSFVERHKLSEEVLTGLTELGDNPFGPTLVVKTREPEDYKKVMSALDVPEYENLIETKSFEGHEEGIEKIQNITNRVERLGFGLSVLFAIISFLIIFNTVRVAIYTHRIEISIKRLVGASSWFIRGPYVVESVIFTILSIGITGGLIYLALRWLDPYIQIVFPNSFSLTNYYNSHIFFLFGLQALAVLLLTIASSFLAMRRQLKA
ncbi:MAG: permease-like cell division protein FtsX [Candidatus Magasanikbacteria bacterium]|nr:permease-like cell division protein FtsX [Candidatus Magasanikbacteria bacterium]